MCDIRKTIDGLRERLDELEDYLCISEEEVDGERSDCIDEEYDDDCCPHCGEPLEDDEDDEDDDYEYPDRRWPCYDPCTGRVIWHPFSVTPFCAGTTFDNNFVMTSTTGPHTIRYKIG